MALYQFDTFHPQVMPEPNSGCWLWSGNIDKDGYGRCRRLGDSVVRRAHREAWAQHNGEIPEGLAVLHKCDVRCCVNPDHLYLGTHQQNVGDRVARDRSCKGERHHKAKLTDAEVAAIRSDPRSLTVVGKLYGIRWQYVWLLRKNRFRKAAR